MEEIARILIFVYSWAAKPAKFIGTVKVNNHSGSYFRVLLWLGCPCDIVEACLIKGPKDLRPEITLKTFSELLHGLQQLKQWLEEENCHHVAMESTGVYWEPVYNIYRRCI